MTQLRINTQGNKGKRYLVSICDKCNVLKTLSAVEIIIIQSQINKKGGKL